MAHVNHQGGMDSPLLCIALAHFIGTLIALRDDGDEADASADGDIVSLTMDGFSLDGTPPHEQSLLVPGKGLGLGYETNANLSLRFLQPKDGPFGTQKSFFVDTRWHGSADMATGSHVVGRMFVELIEPLSVVYPTSIILVHGDWHTGQIWSTKPCGRPGWATYFAYLGYRVYVVDLPPGGRSSLVSDDEVQRPSGNIMSESEVERYLTAPSRQANMRWPTASRHFQWFGSGKPGDMTFYRYKTQLVPMPLRRTERQALGKAALGHLLLRIGSKSIFIGEGSGATIAWLAADAHPDLVAGVVAVEPAGPPAGKASTMGTDGERLYTRHTQFDASLRRYGVADIPLTFDPPLEPNSSRPLDLMPVSMAGGTCLLQRPCLDCELAAAHDPDARACVGACKGVRRLVNLAKMPHVIVTGEASPHSTHDWATAEFLRQAGVPVRRMPLERFGIPGNGHLMFLEMNSDIVAAAIALWIEQYL